MRRANQRHRRATLALAALPIVAALGGGNLASAATAYWDANGAVAGAGGATPTGTWGISNFWSSSAAGTAATGAWTSGDIAVFSAGVDATGTFTVGVSGTQTVTGVTFEEGTVTLSNVASGALSLSGAAAFNVQTSSATVNVAITGGGSLSKTGAGTLTLGGSNSYSGGTTVSAGTLHSNSAAALGSGNITLGSGATLVHNFTDPGWHNFKTLTLTGAATIGVTPGNQINFWGTLNGGGNALTINGGGLFFLGEPSTGTVTNLGAITVTGNTSLGSDSRPAGWGGTAGVPGSGPTVTVDPGSSIGTLNAIMPNPIVLNGTTGGNGAMFAYTSGAGFSGPVTLNATSDVGAVSNFTISGNISGAGGLTKLGSSTITLSGNNTYGGATTVSAGTLRATTATSIPSGGAVSVQSGATLQLPAGGTLDLSGAGSVTAGTTSSDVVTLAPPVNRTFSGTISGPGAVHVTTGSGGGYGYAYLTGTNTFTGGLTVDNAGVAVGSESALGDSAGAIAITNGGEILWTSAFALGATRTGPITVTGVGYLSPNGFDVSVPDAITGTGELHVFSYNPNVPLGGTVRLSGNNTHNGKTVVEPGATVVLENASAAVSGVDVSSAAKLVYDYSGTASHFLGVGLNHGLAVGHMIEVSAGNTIHFTGTMDGTWQFGAGSFSLAGGTFIVDPGAVVTQVGGIGVFAGSLGSNGNSAGWGGTPGVPGSGASIGVDSGGSLQISNGPVMPNPLSVTGSGAGDGVIFNNGPSGGGFSGPIELYLTSSFGGTGDFTVSGIVKDRVGFGPAGLVKLGSNTITLSGVNTYSGGTTINSGAIAVAADSGLGASTGALTFDGGALRFNAGFTLSSSRTITLNAGGGTINTNGFDIAIVQSVSGAGGLTKAGAGNLTLFGAASPAAGTTITGGKLTAVGSFTSGSLNNSAEFASVGTTVSFTATSTNAAAGKINLIGATLNLGSGANKLTNGGRINLIDTTVNGDIQSTSGGVINTAGNVTFTGNITGAGALAVSSGVTGLGASDNRVMQVATLDLASAAQLDVKDNKLIVTAGNAGNASEGVYSGLQGEVQRAYNFGSWDGAGVTTSMQGALDGITTVGVATGEQIRGLGPNDTDVWAGQTINGASVIAMYTYAGDANLDGQIDAGDYGLLDAFIQVAGATGYGNGDFNYDGFIDAADYGTIDNTIQFQGAPFPTSGATADLATVSAVPEPAACGFAALASALLIRRRRGCFM